MTKQEERCLDEYKSAVDKAIQRSGNSESLVKFTDLMDKHLYREAYLLFEELKDDHSQHCTFNNDPKTKAIENTFYWTFVN